MATHLFASRLGRVIIASAWTLLIAGGCVTSAQIADESLPRDAVWLETLDLSVLSQDWGSPQAGKSVAGNAIKIGDRVFAHGVGTHANSEWIIDLHGAAVEFRAVAGIDAESLTGASVVFAVWTDERESFRSSVVRSGEPGVNVAVDLQGVAQMRLVIEDAGDSINYDHADWAGAFIVMAPSTGKRPVSARYHESLPQIAGGSRPEPEIHAPRITGGTPGRPFVFRIPATGEGPLTFAASNLPEGLSLDAYTGIISGAIAHEGRTPVELAVEGPRGKTASKLIIVSGPDALALTPPMGWNSWNVWGTAVDDAKVRAAADALVSTGLAAHGYQYVNIDDAWEGQRDAGGRIQTNEKFPDMKALADYVHSKGLKLGIYSSPGPKTCALYEGSYEHEALDAKTWADWGIDLVKYDWCSYSQIQDPATATTEQFRKPYEVMRKALDDCGRDIVYSLCQYGMGSVWEWGDAVGAHYWRTTGDITDTWHTMSTIGFGQAGREAHAGPGRWNDPDMLVVGKVGWGPTLRNTRLSPNEQLTHITLWSLLAAPMLIGCDLTQLDEFTLSLLTNPEILEVNQDVLGQQAQRISSRKSTEVWARSLSDGTQAVGLFNRGLTPATVEVSFEELRLSGVQAIRDLWQRSDLGVFQGSYSTTVPRHGAVFLKIGSPD